MGTAFHAGKRPNGAFLKLEGERRGVGEKKKVNQV